MSQHSVLSQNPGPARRFSQSGPMLRIVLFLCVFLALPAQALQAQIVSEEKGPRWVGEPVTLSLKDADLAETLRSFAQLGNFNLVLDPKVSGKVTVELKNVPWDQALDAILRTHGLGLDITGGRMMIASPSVITDYRQRLETVRRVELRLRHVDATHVASVLSAPEAKILGSHGAASAQASTNTLVLQETGRQLLRLGTLLRDLDTPEMAELPVAELEKRCQVLWRATGR